MTTKDLSRTREGTTASPGGVPAQVRSSGASSRRVAWVFAGGGARGAYEVGVCSYIFDRVAHSLGRALPLDVISGTSVGAINACALAAGADDPRLAIKRLVARWVSLSLAQVVHLDKRRTFNMIRALVGRGPRHPSRDVERGGILDVTPLEELLSSGVGFPRIDALIAAGKLSGLSLSATHLDSGSTTVFYQCRGAGPEVTENGRGRGLRAFTNFRRVNIKAPHALASAAIPFLFPAVRIDGELYCDGSLRQHVPLSPALALGAEALVVVNPRIAPASNGPQASCGGEPQGEHGQPPNLSRRFPGPLFLLGKTLNALAFDRVDGDIQQLERLNDILTAGTRRFGTEFTGEINGALVDRGKQPLRPISVLHLHASEDLGRLSADFVRSRRRIGRGPRRNGFRVPGLLGRTIARLAEAERGNEGDLLSYFLFDGAFAAELVDLGRRDAARRHDEIVEYFAPLTEPAKPGNEAVLASPRGRSAGGRGPG